MRFAICDDDKLVMDEVRPIINAFSNAKRIGSVVDYYSSGEALVASKTVYDFIILDYKMNDLNGLEVARILRERNCTCVIVFLTSFYERFIFDAFEVETRRFLNKPLDKELLIKALDSYFKSYGFDRIIELPSKGDNVCVEVRDIVFLEASNKNCIVHLKRSKFTCSKTMLAASEKLPENHFFKVNRAFIVNFYYISSYNNEYIYFKNGESVRISRSYLTAFKTAYREYTRLIA